MSPSKKYVYSLLALLLVLIVSGLWILNFKNEAIRHGLQWQIGSSQQYEIEVDSYFDFAMSAGNDQQSMTVKMAADLEFQTIDIGPHFVTVGMRFSAMDMRISGARDATMNTELTHPFRVLFTANGMPNKFEFPEFIAAEYRIIIENLVRMFQINMQDTETWTSSEENSAGRYKANYTRSSPSQVTKKKQHYLTANSKSNTNLGISAISSHEVIEFNNGSDWIAKMTLDETVSSSDPSGLAMNVSNNASLSLKKITGSVKKEQWQFLKADTPSVNYEPKETNKDSVSLEEATLEIQATIARLDAATDGRSRFIYKLRDLLLLDTELPFLIIKTLRTQALSQRTKADLYLSLESAGTPAAQAALTSVIKDTSWSQVDAMRAIVALAGIDKPTDETFTQLWAVANTQLTGELASTAALALGSLGQTLPDGDGSLTSLVSDLFNGATSAFDTHQQASFLHAVGNTADSNTSTLTNTFAYLSHAEPEVRAAAAKTIGRLGPDQVANELMSQLAQEENSIVRASVTEALTSWTEPSPEAVKTIRNDIFNEKDDTVRYNMAKFLGQNIQKYPQNKKILEKVLESEQSKRVRQIIIENFYPKK
jgi:hypothetical protein